VRAIYEAFGRGDVATILDKLDDAVDWDAHAPRRRPIPARRIISLTKPTRLHDRKQAPFLPARVSTRYFAHIWSPDEIMALSDTGAELSASETEDENGVRSY
jgi:hypothetical protein